MTVAEMRRQILAAYDSEDWRKKVTKWNDNQIIAVYFRLKKKGRIK